MFYFSIIHVMMNFLEQKKLKERLKVLLKSTFLITLLTIENLKDVYMMEYQPMMKERQK
ncbi:hypothetical protein [Clostridium sp. UBA3061]|uniref:hypothetical protein n=1 Tax=Clostridium sp. UBA3061 TaxID=1946353 RepID=UPI003216314E